MSSATSFILFCETSVLSCILSLLNYCFRNIVQQCEYSNIGATELILSNGLRVCYKSTDFLDDQVQFCLRYTLLAV